MSKLGSGVVMMSKFIEANGLLNSESPAIFVEVHKELDKKLKRIEKIKAIYADDGDEAPMTKCPQCGSPSLIVRNCEFCGYAMLEGEGSDEVKVETSSETIEKQTEGRTTRRSATDKKIEEDNTPDIKENLVETGKTETTEAKPARTSRAKKEPKMPTKEEINKARRPGLKKIVDAHKIAMTVNMDKAELKDIRIEMLSVLLGEEVPVKETKARTKAATKKEEVKVAVVDFSKTPDGETMENMTEDQLIKVIEDFKLPIPETAKKLKGKIENDDAFFACVDEVIASLKSEEEKQSKAEPEAPVAEVKTRAKRETKSDVKAKAVELVKINIDDLPEVAALEAMEEKKLIEVINKFGLDLDDDVKALEKGDLKDEAFFKIIDNIDVKVEAIANDINDGKEPTYPAVLEVKTKTARAKKSPASEPKLEEGNETDENYEDIDLDNADINYDDINIEDVADQA